MKSIFYLFLIISVLFVACQKEKEEVRELKLNSEIILENYEFGLIHNLLSINNKIIVLDVNHYQSDNFLFLIDPVKEIILDSTGSKGKGPKEMISPKSLNLSNYKNNNFSVYDSPNGKLNLYQINNTNIEYLSFYKITKNMPMELIEQEKNKIFAMLANSLIDKRVTILDSLDNTIDNLGKMLPTEKDNIPINIQHQAAKGKIRISPNGKKVVLTAQYSDIIDIIDISSKKQVRIQDEKKILPIYTISNVNNHSVLTIDVENAKFGYIDVFVAKDKIYALYSGKKFKEKNDIFGGVRSNVIHVFDYEGKLFEKINLDRELQAFTYDETNNIIYGVANDPKPVILKYIL